MPISPVTFGAQLHISGLSREQNQQVGVAIRTELRRLDSPDIQVSADLMDTEGGCHVLNGDEAKLVTAVLNATSTLKDIPAKDLCRVLNDALSKLIGKPVAILTPKDQEK